MTATPNRTDTADLFTFSGSPHVKPLGAIEECSDVLDFLASVLGRGAVDLQLRAPAGLVWILNGIRRTLDSACERLKGEVSEPYARGYKEGSKLAAAEYERGRREAHGQAFHLGKLTQLVRSAAKEGRSIDDVIKELEAAKPAAMAAEPGGRAADDPAA
jgi:hypothetical protein